MIWKELEESLIFVNLEAANYRQVLERLGNAMIREGYAGESYAAALLKREKDFPTGLDIHGIGVAIPHTDACHVIKEGIAAASLKTPVLFYQMGEDGIQIPVSLVFLLAVKEPETHLKRLQGILDIIQDKDILERLLKAGSSEEIIQIIRSKEET